MKTNVNSIFEVSYYPTGRCYREVEGGEVATLEAIKIDKVTLSMGVGSCNVTYTVTNSRGEQETCEGFKALYKSEEGYKEGATVSVCHLTECITTERAVKGDRKAFTNFTTNENGNKCITLINEEGKEIKLCSNMTVEVTSVCTPTAGCITAVSYPCPLYVSEKEYWAWHDYEVKENGETKLRRGAKSALTLTAEQKAAFERVLNAIKDFEDLGGAMLLDRDETNYAVPINYNNIEKFDWCSTEGSDLDFVDYMRGMPYERLGSRVIYICTDGDPVGVYLKK